MKNVLNNPFEISIAMSKPAEGVTQQVYLVHQDQKTELVRHILYEHKDFTSILIFSSTKKDVFQIVRGLTSKGIKAQGISSDLEQKDRESVLAKFKSKDTRISVATDVLPEAVGPTRIGIKVWFFLFSAEFFIEFIFCKF